MIAGCFVVLIFCLWFLVTILYQIFQIPRVARLKRFDLLGLVPFYRLFERPVKNIELLFRESRRDKWREYPVRRLSRFYHIFWSPEVIPTKLLWVYLRSFSNSYHKEREIPMNSPLPMALVSFLAKEEGIEGSLQFQLVEDGTTIFLSAPVRLGPWLNQLSFGF